MDEMLALTLEGCQNAGRYPVLLAGRQSDFFGRPGVARVEEHYRQESVEDELKRLLAKHDIEYAPAV